MHTNAKQLTLLRAASLNFFHLSARMLAKRRTRGSLEIMLGIYNIKLCLCVKEYFYDEAILIFI